MTALEVIVAILVFAVLASFGYPLIGLIAAVAVLTIFAAS